MDQKSIKNGRKIYQQIDRKIDPNIDQKSTNIDKNRRKKSFAQALATRVRTE